MREGVMPCGVKMALGQFTGSSECPQRLGQLGNGFVNFFSRDDTPPHGCLRLLAFCIGPASCFLGLGLFKLVFGLSSRTVQSGQRIAMNLRFACRVRHVATAQSCGSGLFLRGLQGLFSCRPALGQLNQFLAPGACLCLAHSLKSP